MKIENSSFFILFCIFAAKMRRLTLFCIFLLSWLPHLHAQPKHEVRAVWIATIGGIDWPSSYAHDGRGREAQQQQLCRMLDSLKTIHVNTVLLQTRVRATTLYPSAMEPWDACLSGRAGASPGYDALRFAIEECHRRGMELHAWVVTIPVGKWQSAGCKNLRRRYPSMVRRMGDEGYMDPESEMTATYLADLCEEITRRYDIDGIHLDYIRYPEKWRGVMRRQRITHIVRRIHDRVKSLKPWVKLSCAPIGKYDDLARYSSRGWNAYSRVAQEAQSWLRDGLMDQLYPMMYFEGNGFYPFAIDWKEQSGGRTVAAGLGVYMLHPRQGDWQLGEIRRQLHVSRQLGLGHCYYRAKYLLDNVKGVRDYLKAFDSHPALVPPLVSGFKSQVSGFKSQVSSYCDTAPEPPAGLHVIRTAQGDRVYWGEATDHSDGDYLLYNVYASTDPMVDTADPANLIATRLTSCRLDVPYVTRSRQPLNYAVTATDRYGNESQPCRLAAAVPSPHRPSSTLLNNNGKLLTVPTHLPFDAQLLTVNDLQGRRLISVSSFKFQVSSGSYRGAIDISILPDGVYELRSQNRKGVAHRLGTFVIRRF